ncbi:MAG: lipoate--protein ligase [Bacteriovoracaceae bacterium]|nr:lipoate--protein ligase [Bacteriovoracaceae bacterium]
MEVHIIESTNIYLNLALEQALFLDLPEGTRRLLVWKNSPCVVMGRFQNPWVECDLESMVNSGVLLARRQSGGGTVYHDLGNLNISFMDWNDSYDKDNNNQIMINTLQAHNLNAFASGRSDLQLETPEGNKKISGAAFKKKKDRSLHHATMLLNANLDNLNAYLRPKFAQDQVQTKAIASVRSKVANTEIDEEVFKQDLVKSFESFYGSKATIKYWSESEVLDLVEKDTTYLEHLKSWKWICGETPLFKTKLTIKDWDIDIAVKKGIIHEIDLSHPSLHPSYLDELKEGLTGLLLRSKELNDVFVQENVPESYLEAASELKELLASSFVDDFSRFS